MSPAVLPSTIRLLLVLVAAGCALGWCSTAAASCGDYVVIGNGEDPPLPPPLPCHGPSCDNRGAGEAPATPAADSNPSDLAARLAARCSFEPGQQTQPIAPFSLCVSTASVARIDRPPKSPAS